MPFTIDPLPRRMALVQHLLVRCPSQSGALLDHYMGTGKTASVIAVLRELLPDLNVLIVAPTEIRDVWRSEFVKFGVEVPADRLRLVDYDTFMADPARVTAPWGGRRTVMVFDEAHTLLGLFLGTEPRWGGAPEAERVLGLVRSRAAKVLLATGTPMATALTDLRFYAHLVSERPRVPLSLEAFRRRFLYIPWTKALTYGYSLPLLTSSTRSLQVLSMAIVSGVLTMVGSGLAQVLLRKGRAPTPENVQRARRLLQAGERPAPPESRGVLSNVARIPVEMVKFLYGILRRTAVLMKSTSQFGVKATAAALGHDGLRRRQLLLIGQVARTLATGQELKVPVVLSKTMKPDDLKKLQEFLKGNESLETKLNVMLNLLRVLCAQEGDSPLDPTVMLAEVTDNATAALRRPVRLNDLLSGSGVPRSAEKSSARADRDDDDDDENKLGGPLKADLRTRTTKQFEDQLVSFFGESVTGGEEEKGLSDFVTRQDLRQAVRAGLRSLAQPMGLLFLTVVWVVNMVYSFNHVRFHTRVRGKRLRRALGPLVSYYRPEFLQPREPTPEVIARTLADPTTASLVDSFPRFTIRRARVRYRSAETQRLFRLLFRELTTDDVLAMGLTRDRARARLFPDRVYRAAYANAGRRVALDLRVRRVLSLLEDSGPRRCVVFSEFSACLTRVAEGLRRRGLVRARVVRLRDVPDGAPRRAALDAFRDGKVDVLLLDKEFKEGITVKGAWTLIIAEVAYAASQRDQVVARVRRRGTHAHLPPEQRRVDVVEVEAVTRVLPLRFWEIMKRWVQQEALVLIPSLTDWTPIQVNRAFSPDTIARQSNEHLSRLVRDVDLSSYNITTIHDTTPAVCCAALGRSQPCELPACREYYARE